MSVVVFPAVLRHDQHKDGCGAIGRQLGTPALALPNPWLAELVMKPPQDQDIAPLTAIQAEEVDKDTFHIWSSIQKEKEKEKEKIFLPPAIPYVHPLMRRSSSLMSQKSLEICTESLGSETGSDGFSSGDEQDSSPLSPFSSKTEDEEEEADDYDEGEDVHKADMEGKKELAAVNYHCSIGRRLQVRSFPPPLSSISRRDGTCLKMQPHRCNGRLVMEAVPVPSHNYLHAQRHGGRLLLSFVDTSSKSSSPVPAAAERSHYLSQEEFEVEEEMLQAEEEEEEEDELVVEEEEVEVVDRGTIVEVKVSTQPQPVSGAAAVKVHRSSLVINKFVVGSPLAPSDEPLPELDSSPPQEPNSQPNYTPSPPPAAASAKRASVASTTAAAAAVAASSISTPTSTTEGFHYNYLHHHPDSPWGSLSPAAAAAADAKLLFASKRRSREELLHDMRRCSELRRPLFIFEQPHCIATSS